MSHWDESWYRKTPEEEKAAAERFKAEQKFDKDTHTELVAISTGAYSFDIRECTDCLALTRKPEDHRAWHKKNKGK